MSEIAIIGPRAKSTSTDMIIDEAKQIFKKVDFIPIQDVSISIPQRFKIRYFEKSLLDYDYCLLRIDSKRASFGYQLAKALGFYNIKKPYHSRAVLIAHNKFATVFELAKAGLPVPGSAYTASKEAAAELVNGSKFPLIIKLVSSFGGKGVLVAEGETAAKSIVNTLDLLKQDIMLEQYIENAGEDIRAFVVGDQIAASMKRIAKQGEKRANLKSGGKATAVTLTKEEEDISLKAAKAIKADICAIDILRGEDGPKIIEANINPGLKGITKATGTNVAKAVVQHCYDEARK